MTTPHAVPASMARVLRRGAFRGRRHGPRCHQKLCAFGQLHSRHFRGGERFLVVFPEMDHFEIRPSEKYFGPVLGSASDEEFTWPDGSGYRVFIYLSAANRCLGDLINHIRRLGLPAVGVIRDLPESDRKAMESPTLRLSGPLSICIAPPPNAI